MGNQPRQHHFDPEFYLTGFTANGLKDGQLHVFDKSRMKSWTTRPKEAAKQGDFHTVDFEKVLGERLESKWAQVLRQLLESGSLPTGVEFDDLLEFVAFQSVRVPRIREKIKNFVKEALRRQSFSDQHLRTLSASERSRVERLTQADTDQAPLHSQLVCDDSQIADDLDWHVRTMIENAGVVLGQLRHRDCALWKAADDAPDLVCSDFPVCLTWWSPLVGWQPPGWGCRSTIATIPLSKRFVLASAFEHLVQNRLLDRDAVAVMNERTMHFANQIYSPVADFARFAA